MALSTTHSVQWNSAPPVEGQEAVGDLMIKKNTTRFNSDLVVGHIPAMIMTASGLSNVPVAFSDTHITRVELKC